MANDNIFQQYLRPPKSIAEYSAEMDEAEGRKQTLRQNALTLAATKQKYDDGMQSTARQNQLRGALSSLGAGATDEDRVKAMRGTGSQEGFAAADALEKSIGERRKSSASAGKDEAETTKINLARDVALHDFHAQKLATVQTPQDALAWAQEGAAMGLFKQPGQLEQGIAKIQQASQNPQAFAQWKQGAMRGGQTVTAQLKQQLDQFQADETARHNKATESNTIRGQNMADARAKEQNENGRGVIIQTDTGPMLANSRTGTTKPIIGPDGTPVTRTKPLTEFQGKSAAFGDRAMAADTILNGIKPGDYSAAGVNMKTSLGNVPGIGGGLEAGANTMLSANSQKVEQAQRDFINATLRQESGAAIGASEFENAKRQYFPQPGDRPETIQQKAANRKLVIQGFKRSAGANAEFTDSAPQPAGAGGWTVTPIGQ